MNRLRRTSRLLWVAGTLAAATVGAATPASAAQTDFGSMSFLLGTWSCSGQAVNGTAFRLTEVTKMSPDGSRMVTRDSTGKTSTELWYDAARKLWVETSTNLTDGSNSSETSPGWTGDTLILTGDVNIKGMPSLGYRSTTTKLSPVKTKQVDELQAQPGAGWMEFDSATCDKKQ